MKPQRFRNRTDAGRQLAEKLAAYANQPDVLVLALPRGGVPVGFEVAERSARRSMFLSCASWAFPDTRSWRWARSQPAGVRVLNDEIVRGLGIPEIEIDAAAARELQELVRRERLYRGDRPSPDVGGRTVILVDDGLATGATMRAALAGIETAAARPHRRSGADRLPRHL